MIRKRCCGCWLQTQNTSHIWAITSPFLLHIFVVWLQQSLEPVANIRCSIFKLKYLSRLSKVNWGYRKGVEKGFYTFPISLIYFLILLRRFKYFNLTMLCRMLATGFKLCYNHTTKICNRSGEVIAHMWEVFNWICNQQPQQRFWIRQHTTVEQHIHF